VETAAELRRLVEQFRINANDRTNQKESPPVRGMAAHSGA
jgi:hypothetical protein